MIKDVDSYNFELLRVEKGQVEKYKFIFRFEESGEWPVEMGEKYYNLFRVGNMYKAKMIVDNIGEKKEGETYWVNLNLESILEKNKVIWQSSASTA